MKEEVSIFIEGIVQDGDEDRIITNATGRYRRYDKTHILKYEDPDNGLNIIKISPLMVEIIKIGDNRTHMVFDLNESTQSEYETQYGSLFFQIKTTAINIVEKHNEIILNMEYSLSHSDSHISDNRIHIEIKEINN